MLRSAIGRRASKNRPSGLCTNWRFSLKSPPTICWGLRTDRFLFRYYFSAVFRRLSIFKRRFLCRYPTISSRLICFRLYAKLIFEGDYEKIFIVMTLSLVLAASLCGCLQWLEIPDEHYSQASLVEAPKKKRVRCSASLIFCRPFSLACYSSA